MGKGILVIVLGAALAGAILTLSSNKTAAEADAEVSGYEAELVAREIARSGLNKAVAEVRRRAAFDAAAQFINASAQFDGQIYSGGTFDVEATALSAGTLRLVATGRYVDVEHQIHATLVQVSPVGAALMVQSPSGSAVPSFGGSVFRISGNDTQPPSSTMPPDPLHDRPAILTDNVKIRDAFRSALLSASGVIGEDFLNNLGRIRRVDGAGDVVESASFELSPSAVYAEAISSCEQTWEGKQRLDGHTTLGSPDAPGIFCVKGDLEVAGSLRGYGVLVAEGSFEMDGDFTWEGIVLARETTGLQVQAAGSARIYGSLMLVPDGWVSAFRMPAKGRLKVSFTRSVSAVLQSSVHVWPEGGDPAMIFEPASDHRGATTAYEVPFEEGQGLNFFIKVYEANGVDYLYDHYAAGYRAPSGRSYAQVTRLGPLRWELAFEDLDEIHSSSVDWDLNDQVIEVEVQCEDETACEALEGSTAWTLEPGETTTTATTGLTFRMEGAASILYSAEALGRLSAKLQTIQAQTQIVATEYVTAE